jgi:hypothetical protein
LNLIMFSFLINCYVSKIDKDEQIAVIPVY